MFVVDLKTNFTYFSKDNKEGQDCQFPCKRPIPELNFEENRGPPEKM